MKMKKILKKCFFIAIAIYVSVTFINQQKALNAYKNEQTALSNKIKEQTEYKETLLATKENVSSPEYIEALAREKLNMYLPNERVYVDMGK